MHDILLVFAISQKIYLQEIYAPSEIQNIDRNCQGHMYSTTEEESGRKKNDAGTEPKLKYQIQPTVTTKALILRKLSPLSSNVNQSIQSYARKALIIK